MGVAFVRRELVEVAEIERFNGRRKKAEYVEPVAEGRTCIILYTSIL